MDPTWASYQPVLQHAGVRNAAVLKSQSLSKAFDIPELDSASKALHDARISIRSISRKVAVSAQKNRAPSATEDDLAKLHASVAATVQQTLAQYHAQLPAHAPERQGTGDASIDPIVISGLDRAVQALVDQVGRLEESCTHAAHASASRMGELAGQVGALGEQVTGQGQVLQEMRKQQTGLQEAVHGASTHITAVQSSVTSLAAQQGRLGQAQDELSHGVQEVQQQVQALAAAKHPSPVIDTKELMLSAAAAGAGAAASVLSDAQAHLRAAAGEVAREVVAQARGEIQKAVLKASAKECTGAAAPAVVYPQVDAPEREEDEDDGFPILPPGQSSVIPFQQAQRGARLEAVRGKTTHVVQAHGDITMSQLLPASNSYSGEAEERGERPVPEGEERAQAGAANANAGTGTGAGAGAGPTFTRSKRRVIETQAEEERWAASMHRAPVPIQVLDPADIDVTPTQQQGEGEGEGVGVGLWQDRDRDPGTGAGRKLIRSGMKSSSAKAQPQTTRTEPAPVKATTGRHADTGTGAAVGTGTGTGRRLRPIERAAESVPQDICGQEGSSMVLEAEEHVQQQQEIDYGSGDTGGAGGEGTQAVLDPAALAAASRRRQALLRQLENSSGFVTKAPVHGTGTGQGPTGTGTGTGTGRRPLAQVSGNRTHQETGDSKGTTGIGSTRKAALDTVKRNLADMDADDSQSANADKSKGDHSPSPSLALAPVPTSVPIPAKVVQLLGTPSQPMESTAQREEAAEAHAAAAIASLVSDTQEEAQRVHAHAGAQAHAHAQGEDAWAAALADSAASQSQAVQGGSAGSDIADRVDSTPLSQGVTVTGKPKHMEPTKDGDAEAMFAALAASTTTAAPAGGSGQGKKQVSAAKKKPAAVAPSAVKAPAAPVHGPPATIKARGGTSRGVHPGGEHMLPPPLPTNPKAGYTGMIPPKAQAPVQQAGISGSSRTAAPSAFTAPVSVSAPVGAGVKLHVAVGGGLRSAAVYEALTALGGPVAASRQAKGRQAGASAQPQPPFVASSQQSHHATPSGNAGAAATSLGSLFLPSASQGKGTGTGGGGPQGGSAGDVQAYGYRQGEKDAYRRATGSTSVSPPVLVRPQSQSQSQPGMGAGRAQGKGKGTSGIEGWGGGGTVMQEDTLGMMPGEEEGEERLLLRNQPITAKKSGAPLAPAAMGVDMVPPPVPTRSSGAYASTRAAGGKTGSASVRFAPSVSHHAYEGGSSTGQQRYPPHHHQPQAVQHGQGGPVEAQGQEEEEEDDLDIMASQPTDSAAWGVPARSIGGGMYVPRGGVPVQVPMGLHVGPGLGAEGQGHVLQDLLEDE